MSLQIKRLIKLCIVGWDFIQFYHCKHIQQLLEDVLQSWSNIYYEKCQTDSYFHCDMVSKITVRWRSVFSKRLYISGILYVNDLIDENSNLHAFD